MRALHRRGTRGQARRRFKRSAISLNLASIKAKFYFLYFHPCVTMPEKKENDGLSPVPSQIGHVEGQSSSHDAVFGEITEEGPNYRNVRMAPLKSGEGVY